MFLLISDIPRSDRRAEGISIHLMFLLIQVAAASDRVDDHFNTSHVSINRGKKGSRSFGKVISIHLMFLLIEEELTEEEQEDVFQYISCFY